jgi:hypothetical protein
MKISPRGITLLSITSIIALTTAPTIAQTNGAQTNSGISFESSSTLNQTTLIQNWVNHEETYDDTSVTYSSAHCREGEESGHIPADVHGPTVLISSQSVTPYKSGHPKTKAFFRSATTPPAEGLRVIIQNQSIGGGTTPYSDREYDKSSKSEKFYVAPEDEHKGKYLAVQKGKNQMRYEIRRGQQVIESGEFIANITIEDRHITRRRTQSANRVEIPCIKKHRHDDHKHKHKKHKHAHHYDRPVTHEIRNPIFEILP